MSVHLTSGRTGEQETGNWEWAMSSLFATCAGGLRGGIQDRGQLGCLAKESAMSSPFIPRFPFSVHQFEGADH